jgi:geranylgeranyl reductase family protein
MSRYDAVIVGAGPAGSAAGALFAAQGRRVLLLDKATFPRPKPCAEYVSPGGVEILERLGALERIERTGRRRWLDGMRLTSAGGRQYTVRYTDITGQPRQGLSVSRQVLDLALVELACARGAHLRQMTRVRDVWMPNGRVAGVILQNGECVEADLVVGADGLHSTVARVLGAVRGVRWPRRLGLIAHYDNVEWPESVGQMQFGRCSYVGVAPLDHAGRLTVGVVSAMPRGRLGQPAAALKRLLSDHADLARHLAGHQPTDSVSGIGPLARRVARVAGPGFALLGDAAGFFDPATGEGIFRALRSAELLAGSPDAYARRRAAAFGPKQRLVVAIQVLVQKPTLMDFALDRLRARPSIASEFNNVLGDLQLARLDLMWRLLGP